MKFRLMNVDGGGDLGGGAGGVAATPPGAGAGGEATSWYSGFSTPELRGTVENKGWKSAEDVVRGYSELEKVVGYPKDYLLKLPQKDDDAEGWNQVYAKLGRPDKPESYGLDKLKNADPEYASMISKVMYESGVSAKQAQAIVGKHGEFLESFMAKQAEQGKLKADAETVQLKSEWGEQYQATVERGGQALKDLWGDKSDAVMEALQSKFGVRETALLVAKLADKSGEATFRQSGEGTGGHTGFGMSPDGAKAKIAQMKADPEFTKALFGDNKIASDAAKNQLQRLMQMAYPGQMEGKGLTA